MITVFPAVVSSVRWLDFPGAAHRRRFLRRLFNGRECESVGSICPGHNRAVNKSDAREYIIIIITTAVVVVVIICLPTPCWEMDGIGGGGRTTTRHRSPETTRIPASLIPCLIILKRDIRLGDFSRVETRFRLFSFF